MPTIAVTISASFGSKTNESKPKIALSSDHSPGPRVPSAIESTAIESTYS